MNHFPLQKVFAAVFVPFLEQESSKFACYWNLHPILVIVIALEELKASLLWYDTKYIHATSLSIH